MEAQRLDAWRRNGRPVATTGIVLQEVLQGARTERDLNLLRARLGRLRFCAPTRKPKLRLAA